MKDVILNDLTHVKQNGGVKDSVIIIQEGSRKPQYVVLTKAELQRILKEMGD